MSTKDSTSNPSQNFSPKRILGRGFCVTVDATNKLTGSSNIVKQIPLVRGYPEDRILELVRKALAIDQHNISAIKEHFFSRAGENYY